MSRDVDFAILREELGCLPRAWSHAPGVSVEFSAVYTPMRHRSALDPDRTLVVGNRGMGKSFWTHALTNQAILEHVALVYSQPSLSRTTVSIGFNAAPGDDGVAPSADALADLMQRDNSDPETIWQTVLLRAAAKHVPHEFAPDSLAAQVSWTRLNQSGFEQRMTWADQTLAQSGRRLLVVFDALDRLGRDGASTRVLAKALLRRALTARSYRAIRMKLFMRPDQVADPGHFDFADASKLKNDKVELDWTPIDLYGLLFHRLFLEERAGAQLRLLFSRLGLNDREARVDPDRQKHAVDALAGEFMGSGTKRGRVYTWLPLHLSDAQGQVSPRTFLTAWREAALHGSAPTGQAVDHLGIKEGVRRASEDRFNELSEDYRWIQEVMTPLRNHRVPMEQTELDVLWQRSKTLEGWGQGTKQVPFQVDGQSGCLSTAQLLQILQAIGVVEVRRNGKINVPDIIRVQAGIKRHGGVPPARARV